MINEKKIKETKCQGDFCGYLKEHDYEAIEVDYDILLEKVKKAYSSSGDKEAVLIKLNRELEQLTKSREQKKNKEIIYILPYNCLLLGRKIIEKAKNSDLSDALVGKDSISNAEILELRTKATKFPTKYYEFFKVCYICYEIYSFLIRKYRLVPTKSSIPKRSGSRLLKNSIDSELGPLNKDNIDDLLLDMSFYLTKSEMDCDERVKNIYSSMTEINILKAAEARKIHRPSRNGYRNPSSNSVSISLIPSTTSEVPNQNRRNKRILSKVGEFYLGKPKKIGSRLVIK